MKENPKKKQLSNIRKYSNGQTQTNTTADPKTYTEFA